MNLINLKPRRKPEWPICLAYEEAAEQCGAGYEDEELCRVVLAKTLAMNDKSGPLGAGMERWLLPFMRYEDNAPSVVDFGGGCGWHCFSLKSTLSNLGISPDQWLVQETPAMVNVAKPLEDGVLKLAEHHEYDPFNIVICSGSLQYDENPLRMAENLTCFEPDIMFYTRLALLDGEERLITVQASWLSENGPGPLPPGFKDRQVKYPLTLIGKDTLERTITQAGYRMVAHWDEGVAHRDVGQNGDVRAYGYLWERE